jgi:alpha-aminoadipate carrier protein LysW
MTTTAKTVAACPECGGEVAFAAPPLANEVIPCGDCGADLEVRGVAPLELSLAPEVEEDWGE